MKRHELKKLSVLLSLLVLLVLSACDAGFKTVGDTEHAVLFRATPTWLPFYGGGLEKRVFEPGGTVFVLPWEQLYTLDTSLRTIGWGGVGQGNNLEVEDYVETRALDGNEVGLAMTVSYQVDPQMLPHVIERVGDSNEKLTELVAIVARADIRTHMNTLYTWDFANEGERRRAVEQVMKAMNKRLGPEGIIVRNVIYNAHRFERALGDGNYDRSYQEKIDQTQATNQETQQEKRKVAGVVEDKKRQYNEELARVNRVVAEAEGKKLQSTLRGDSYLQAKTIEADQVRQVGMSEVEGLKKRIAAWSGPGGEAMLRLELADYLTKNKPKFFLLNSPSEGKGGLDVTRIDANDLLRQSGIVSAISEAAGKESAAPSPTAAAK